jgi:hypothetical protein
MSVGAPASHPWAGQYVFNRSQVLVDKTRTRRCVPSAVARPLGARAISRLPPQKARARLNYASPSIVFSNGSRARASSGHPAADGYVTSQRLDASEPEQLRHAFELVGAICTAIVTNTPHNTGEACAIVRNLIALVEGQHVDFAAALFRSIWGAEPGRLLYLNRPSFFGEILCC